MIRRTVLDNSRLEHMGHGASGLVMDILVSRWRRCSGYAARRRDDLLPGIAIAQAQRAALQALPPPLPCGGASQGRDAFQLRHDAHCFAGRFTGQREDATIGLYFYNARYLDPQLGRFAQADTIVPEPGDPQALNRYSYTLNNPLRYTDPTGHCPMCISALVGAAAGAIVAYGGQVYNNLQNSNMTIAQALTTNISGRQILTGAAVGGLAGLTMGAGAALFGSGAGATLASGAAAGWTGGRADSLAEATWMEYDRWRAGQSVEIGRLWDDAIANGLLDPTRMIIDTGSGALSAGVGKAFGTFLQKAGLVELISTHTTSRSPVTIKGFLPNGKGVVLDFGRAPLELSLETWEQLMNAFQAGNVELAQEILSQTIDETISGTTNP